jgi:hypothetical protein
MDRHPKGPIPLPQIAQSLWQTLCSGFTSNRSLNGKSLEVLLNSPYDLIANRFKASDGSPRRDIHRTWSRLIPQMMDLLEQKRKQEEQLAA